MVAYKYRKDNKIIIECHAEHLLEPVSSFLFCTQKDTAKVIADVKHELMCSTQESNGVQLSNGYKTNVISRGISKGTAPGFPFIVEFHTNDNSDLT